MKGLCESPEGVLREVCRGILRSTPGRASEIILRRCWQRQTHPAGRRSQQGGRWQEGGSYDPPLRRSLRVYYRALLKVDLLPAYSLGER